jgi:hypothetical protein
MRACDRADLEEPEFESVTHSARPNTMGFRQPPTSNNANGNDSAYLFGPSR